MDEDDFELNNNSGQDYGNSNSSKIRRRLEKRPAQRIEDDFEDDDELFSEMRDDARERDSSRAQGKKHQQLSSGFTSASKHYQQGRKGRGTGSGAETRRAPVEEEDADDDDVEDRGPTFRTETMHGVFKEVWLDPATRVQKEALEMSSEFLRLFTIEALHRTAGYQREQEDEELKDVETLVELDSLEAITPQLVMDF
ncbi:hypothetical protein BGZ96_005839 [Linnemannia gamsii]|uniref:Centromere protein X n=1 Tax=Linnemannia gamsii TaxID=64522 RepID=A0ABQ7K512_9FUNG|nr:hypothetical protein BGZ96_005839 [Linnemannia gamsii]